MWQNIIQYINTKKNKLYHEKHFLKQNHYSKQLTQKNLLCCSIMVLGMLVQAAAKDGSLSMAPKSDIKLWLTPATVQVRMDENKNITRSPEIKFEAARQEYEHIQICLRSSRKISGITVKFSDLRGRDGIISKENLSWRQVTYVNCKAQSKKFQYRYEAKPGWWPDPLIEAASFNLEPGITQPVWLALYVPKGTKPGIYKGGVTIAYKQTAIAEIPVQVEVWNIDLPNPGRVNTTFSFYYPFKGGWHWMDVMSKIYGKFTPELKEKYFNFLGRHRIPVDNLYLKSPMPFEDYELSMKNHGKNFNLICVPVKNKDIDSVIKQLEPFVKELEEKKLLDRFYVYGFDEYKEKSIPEIRNVFGAIKKRWPKLRTMATLCWAPSPDLPVDIWVTTYYKQDEAAVAKWLAAGKEYRWYHSCVPREPFMNTFIEKPVMNARLMMWLAAANKVSGWLYYCVNRWSGKRSILKITGPGPRVDFDPATWEESNGDGNFIYPGADGPVSSARLENLLDGIEDWELLIQLREAAKRAHLKKDIVKDFADVLVKSAKLHTRDPGLISRVRRSAAKKLIKLNAQLSANN